MSIPFSSNLLKMAIAQFLLQLQFWFPIWVIFLLDRGLSLSEIVIADIIYWASIILLEFPMGAISDKIGRRRTYFLGALLGGFAYFLMLFITNFTTLVMTWLIWAVFISTISGTDNAYIYELIMAEDLLNESRRIFGLFTAIRYASILISTLLASFLYVIQMELPILLNAIFAGISALTILLLPKTPLAVIHRPLSQFQQVISILKSNRIVFDNTIMAAMFFVYTWTSTLLLQPLLLDYEIDVELFSLVFGFFTLFGVLGGWLSHYLSNFFGDVRQIYISAILIILSMLFMGILPGMLGIIGIVLLNFNYAIIYPIFIDRINPEIQNDVRASVLSFINLVGSTGLMISRPLIAYIAGITSNRSSYIVWSGIGVLLLFALFRINSQE